jgi:hypothetical protein
MGTALITMRHCSRRRGALGIVSPAAQMSSPNLYDLGSVTDIGGNTVELSLFKARPPSSAAQPP